MTRVAKVVEIIGTSENSWQEAADNALQEAKQSIDHISGIEVNQMTAHVENGNVARYRTTLKIAFGVQNGTS